MRVGKLVQGVGKREREREKATESEEFSVNGIGDVNW